MKLKSLISATFMLVVLLFGLLPAPQVAAAATTCDWVQFVADVTIPDGTTFKAGDTFNKTWKIKNIGTCTWSTDYTLVFVSGAQMNAPASVKLPNSVAPGQTIDLTVAMTAPATTGTQRGNWQLKNASGTLFGLGASANKPFWVEIRVTDGTVVTGYDFVANADKATWASGAGTLTFPGTDGDVKGFVKKVDSPKLENGTTDTGPGLLTVPQDVYNGYIEGKFPAFRVEKGDRFQAVVNCEYNATSCYANFRLMYQIGTGAPQTFWSFNERHEGLFYRVNLDLSSLAGKDVQFILRINAAGNSTGDRALWGTPKLVRGGTVTITPTVTGTPPTPTVTKTATTPASTCDRATFVADVTIPDGSTLAPNTAFTKTWRIKNTGTCTWTTNYSLVFVSGEKMGGVDTNLKSTIAPNTTVEVSVNLTSPAANGTYRGYWQLKNDKGQVFGIGSAGNKPFWVDIKVAAGVTVTPVTPSPSGAAFDFLTNASSATWTSGAGTLTLPGTDGDAKGFAQKLDSIKIETGATDTRGSLLMAPQAVTDGFIRGTFPAFTVQNGDRFQATIGCQQGASGCYVTYRLEYQEGTNPTKVFWAFNERNEGLVYNVNLDLSSLAGKNVKFILANLAAGSPSGDRAVWTAPRIVRAGATVPTNTPTVTGTPPTPTVTATATLTPTATATSPVSNWNLYNNIKYSFKFNFPPGSSIASQSDNVARINLPVTAGTNLVEKYVEVNVVENATTCKSPASGGTTATSQNVTINGIQFLQETGTGAAAGNQYDWNAYSTTQGVACISITFILHSANPGNFTTPPVVFDPAAESAVFTTIMSTFAWITP